jgi:head-tail adaptor
MTRAGCFDRQIVIERPVSTPDTTYGTPVITWTPIASGFFRAEVQDAMPSRSESVQQGLTVARNQTRIRLRWRDDIDSSMRVKVYGDSATPTVYQIVGGPAMVGGRKEMIEIMCERYSS